jgi:hypothetical protein
MSTGIKFMTGFAPLGRLQPSIDGIEMEQGFLVITVDSTIGDESCLYNNLLTKLMLAMKDLTGNPPRKGFACCPIVTQQWRNHEPLLAHKIGYEPRSRLLVIPLFHRFTKFSKEVTCENSVTSVVVTERALLLPLYAVCDHALHFEVGLLSEVCCPSTFLHPFLGLTSVLLQIGPLSHLPAGSGKNP